VQVHGVVAERAVEALDGAVLDRLAGLNEVDLDAPRMSPGVERAPRELRAVDRQPESRGHVGRGVFGRAECVNKMFTRTCGFEINPCSNKHVHDWPEIFAGDEILTTAILDRLLTDQTRTSCCLPTA
jgi:hypothetical protein